MKCENCPLPAKKLTEIEAMNLLETERYWLCDGCLKDAIIPRNNGTWVIRTGNVRESN